MRRPVKKIKLTVRECKECRKKKLKCQMVRHGLFDFFCSNLCKQKYYFEMEDALQIEEGQSY